MIDIKKMVRKKNDITKFRHDLHRIPETAFTEKKTAAYITTHLKQENIAVQMCITMWRRYSFLSGEIKRVQLLTWDWSRS
jgi:metal-dependent amidase/aminoacylase/carboxypeptidase family protein